MIGISDAAISPTKTPITSFRQLTNQVRNATVKAPKGVTLKLNKILIHLQPPSVVKLDPSKHTRSANNSLSSSIIVHRPEKVNLSHKKSLLEFSVQGLNKSREGFKIMDPSSIRKVAPVFKKPNQRSMSNGHLRPIEKSILRETTFVRHIGTPQAVRFEKASPVQEKVARAVEPYYRLNPDDSMNKTRMTPESIRSIVKRNSRQNSMVDLKADFSRVEADLNLSNIIRIQKKARPVKINSVVDFENSRIVQVEKKDNVVSWRNLIFNITVSAEVLKNHRKIVKEGLNYAINNLKPPSISYVESRQVVLERRNKKHSKTLILDLDETLITSCKSEDGPDLILTPREGVDVKIMIKVRPYAQQFLNIMKEHFEILVFTASSQLYAHTVVRALDPKGECVSQIFHREFCFETNKGLRIKDLRIFRNRELKDMIIVDNFVPAFSFQLENGVPILEWKGDKEDKELLYLMEYLIKAKEYKDMRDYNRERLHLLELAKENIEEDIII